ERRRRVRNALERDDAVGSNTGERPGLDANRGAKHRVLTLNTRTTRKKHDGDADCRRCTRTHTHTPPQLLALDPSLLERDCYHASIARGVTVFSAPQGICGHAADVSPKRRQRTAGVGGAYGSATRVALDSSPKSQTWSASLPYCTWTFARS